MTTTIRARGAHELLSYIPFRLRYHPHESVVLVSLRAPNSEVGLVARMDVGDLADIDVGPAAARAFVRHVIADGAESTFLAVYTDAPLRHHGGGRAAARVRAAVEHCREAVECAVGPVQVWVVAPTGYADLDCTDLQCCPPEGRDLGQLSSGRVDATMTSQGIEVASSRAARMRIPAAPQDAQHLAHRAAVESARQRSEARSADAAHGGGRETSWNQNALDAWLRLRDESGGTTARDPVLVGEVGAGLEALAVRDAVLLSTVPGADYVARETARGIDVDEATGDAIMSIMDPQIGLEPRSQADSARTALEAVVAHGEGGAAALTLLAFLAWWTGDGGLAGDRVRSAFGVDPRYRLAHLLDSAVQAGVPPGWVVRARR